MLVSCLSHHQTTFKPTFHVHLLMHWISSCIITEWGSFSLFPVSFAIMTGLLYILPLSTVYMWRWQWMRQERMDFLSSLYAIDYSLPPRWRAQLPVPVGEFPFCQRGLMNNESLTFCYSYLPLVTSQTVKGVYLRALPLQMLDIKN